MRYFNDVKMESIRPIKDGYIAYFENGYKSTAASFMDYLGRLSDESYFSIKERPYDDFFDVKLNSDNRALMDRAGRLIFKYEVRGEIYPFYDGIAVFKSEKFGRNYFLTESGEMLGQEFEDVRSFYNGTGSVRLSNNKYILVNRDMMPISPEFDFIEAFENERYTWAVIDKKICIIDREFNIVNDHIFDKSGREEPYWLISHIYDNDLILHIKKFENGEFKQCLVSIDGKQLGDYHTRIVGFVEGISRVFDDDGTRYIDENGEYITKKAFTNCDDFSEGFAVVGSISGKNKDKFAFLKKDGTLMKFNISKHHEKAGHDGIWFKYASYFSEGKGLVMFNGDKRYPVTADGKILKGVLQLETRYYGFAKCKTENGKYTFLDRNNNPVNMEFDWAYNFNGNNAIVRIEKSADVFNISGFMLSSISEMARMIENDPNLISELPDDIFKDKSLVVDFLDLAKNSAIEKNDKYYLSKEKQIRQKAMSKINNPAGKSGLGE